MISAGSAAELAEVAGRDVSRETLDRLDLYERMLRTENSRQNLVSAATLDDLWKRHILDSAQLVRFEPRLGASWVDVGSGAGLPGIVIACLVSGSVTLVEPRRLRAEFLWKVVTELGVAERVRVFAGKAEKASGKFDAITARAVAPLDKILAISTHLSTKRTRWVLPKGRNAQRELVEARRNWHCEAEIVPSCTDPDSGIVVLSGVRAKGKR